MNHSLTAAITFAGTVLGGVVAHLVPSDLGHQRSGLRTPVLPDVARHAIDLRTVVLKRVGLGRGSWNLLNAALEATDDVPPQPRI